MWHCTVESTVEQEYSNEQRIWFSSADGVDGVEVSIANYIVILC